MSPSLNVKSSSALVLTSNITEGRTVGGGIGNTVIIIQSGLDNLGFNPINLQSISDIFLKIS